MAELYDIYDEQRRLASAKERLRKMSKKTAWGQPTEEEWSIGAPAFYKNDLRENLVVEAASDSFLDQKKAHK